MALVTERPAVVSVKRRLTDAPNRSSRCGSAMHPRSRGKAERPASGPDSGVGEHVEAGWKRRVARRRGSDRCRKYVLLRFGPDPSVEPRGGAEGRLPAVILRSFPADL